MTIIKPVLSEKSNELSKKGILCFFVLPSANKFQIKKEFEDIFKVKIKKIRVSRKKPVLRSLKHLQKSPTKAYTKLQKKAFIELKPGQEFKGFF